MAANDGYYFTFTTVASGPISATWTLLAANNIRMDIYSGNPFVGQANPAHLTPPSGSLISNTGNVTVLTVASSAGSAGSYTVYFYNQGNAISTSTTGTVVYVVALCP